MRSTDVLADGFGRLPDLVHGVLDGCPAALLTERIDPRANTVAWLLWHLARVQDAQVAEVAGTAQRWEAGGWVDRFALSLPRGDTGYGHDPDQVAAVQAGAELLAGYADDVCRATLAYVAGLDDGDLDRVVDERWDPQVTLGVRLVSILDDDLQHAGQAAFLRGVLERRGAA